MNVKLILSVSMLALCVQGCATRASSVTPVAIAAADYANLPCAEAQRQLVATRERVATLSDRQNQAAAMDAVGVFLVLLPVSSLFGGNVTGELAQAKGEEAALARTIQGRCAAA